MYKIAIVVGARPQFIKLAPLLHAFPAEVELDIIHTGQHYDMDMSSIFFDQLNLPDIDFHLGVGSGGQAQQTGKMMIKLEKVLVSEMPDALIVIGDTNSTLAGALAAAKLRIPLLHIEAGLRSEDKHMPEQINRVVTDRLADLLCCPDSSSVENLRLEGIASGVELTGDILYDLIRLVEPGESQSSKILAKFNLSKSDYLFLTMHRAENVDDPVFLKAVLDGLHELSEPVFIPLHPRTLKQLKRFRLLGRLQKMTNVIISNPVGILESLALVRNAKAVLTDSGGVQREAAFYDRPVYVLRHETEWRELENSNAVCCIGSDLGKIDLDSPPKCTVSRDYFKPASGDIVKTILEFLSRML